MLELVAKVKIFISQRSLIMEQLWCQTAKAPVHKKWLDFQSSQRTKLWCRWRGWYSAWKSCCHLCQKEQWRLFGPHVPTLSDRKAWRFIQILIPTMSSFVSEANQNFWCLLDSRWMCTFTIFVRSHQSSVVLDWCSNQFEQTNPVGTMTEMRNPDKGALHRDWWPNCSSASQNVVESNWDPTTNVDLREDDAHQFHDRDSWKMNEKKQRIVLLQLANPTNVIILSRMVGICVFVASKWFVFVHSLTDKRLGSL